MQIIYCHGWGFDSTYMHKFKDYLDFGGVTHDFVDLGYFGRSKTPKPKKPYVLIGHSLGFVKGLEIYHEPSFCVGIDPCISPPNHIDQMIHNFEKNPEVSLKLFYKICGEKGVFPHNLNQDKLMEDLKFMKTVNYSQNKGNYEVLFLSSRHDDVLSTFPKNTSYIGNVHGLNHEKMEHASIHIKRKFREYKRQF